MFSKILIANRGEIAVRIMRTCRKMGIRTVAVYSEADTNAYHVKEADEAIYIGPSPSIKSYLNIDNIVSAIEHSGAEAVHPGYGFLSENAEFARRLDAEGVTLIGPSAEAVRLMGDKIESKKIAVKAGVSSVPGTLGVITSDDEARKVVKEIGFPVMIKAAAGGGGKGMRVARNEKELIDGLKSSANEAASAFKDGRVFIERFFENPRHIEIQILGDRQGNILWLGERECSIQRRHQKVIEEAPSSFLDDKTRKKMGEQAVALAKEVGYYSAGTVEFIMDEDKNFYFLEMNTRLQVEHRVTELVTGIDLVEQMIRVAAGEPLAFTQKDIKLHGWAFESRIYAEDPRRAFLPSTGRITRYLEPENMDNVLIDTAIFEGGEVSMFYDPMVAKVCTFGETRDQAIEIMREALSAFIIEGIAHNASFLEAILGHPRFARGDISTNFIEQEYPGGFIGAELTNETTKIFLGAAVSIFLRDAERASRGNQQLPGRERAIGARWVVNIDGEDYPVYVRHDQDKGYFITHNRKLISVKTGWKLGRRLFQATINGKPVSVQIRHLEEGFLLTYGGADVRVRVRTPRVAELAQFMPRPKDQNKKDELKAPIAGLVVSIRVKEGQEVKAGQELMVIEAMKMENVIYADHDTAVTKIPVAERESVQVDQLLMQFAA
ncbi:MAG: acetyl/propionyl/methylcrotonyl-CoA carboxylase subunit alpha [Pseudomonadota bacterium]|nr:acetyl/propionyl/methylcrotonyl-CoA carboxylase subunit alpha [Pseudomonadota bacterium]MDE3038393.1 acetyl/propionyl/methylcrotonyl-CoA carboxylase subunit alpha [Pseudomonadota bacterium]